MVCENGYWRASRKCADGTFCKDNMCVNADYVPSSVIYGGNGAHISNSQGGETVQGSGVIPGGGTTPTGEVVQGSGNSDAGSYNSGVVYETITSTSCEGVSETGELSDYDETTELGNDLDTNESEGVNVSKVDTVNGSNNPDEYQGLNEDSTKESGATSRILAVNGFGTFASLVSAVVVSAVLSFA
ncbi:hypothetical protein J3B02_004982 [Coemansia erecta]|uniref:Uncharacterized protein n=1 Tax=Coemansia asiatica TaxID=1052880 RepID=A0A9W8CIU2_9FUNG|nr:hypothetical protein LPJ64_003371 [Coemansia asiatica]KAJ2844370.1 hypothetical protein J3B02_004982 [Coemansia erecta]